VRFYDGATKKTLLEKALTRGETFTVPAEVADPRLWTGHPESLDITIGGQSVPKLADGMKTMKDVPVTAAALLARNAPPVPSATPSANPSSTPSAMPTDNAPRPVRSHKPRARHKTGGETVTAGGVLPAGVPLVTPSPAASGVIPDPLALAAGLSTVAAGRSGAKLRASRTRGSTSTARREHH
jgi:hypothetical protein